MTSKEKIESRCKPTNRNVDCNACAKVESVISVDERGQMVLPKKVRDKARISSGDKLAVVSWEKDGEICCISLIKADDFSEMAEDLLGPMMEEITSKKNGK